MGVPCKWITDSQHFLSEHFDIIQSSPSHIYCSALPLCPPASWLQKCYNVEPFQVFRIVRGLQTKWGTYPHTVLLNSHPKSLSCSNNTIAIGLQSGNITILNTISGSQTTLSGHTKWVSSLDFSLDGKSLVSGSHDTTVRLWNVQTGDVITFHGHAEKVICVSISMDCTRIASGSFDETICLWDIQTRRCFHSIGGQMAVKYLSFSPTDPEQFISISGFEVMQWDISGHQTESSFPGYYIALSPDNSQYAICYGKAITIRNSSSGAIVTKCHMPGYGLNSCCFSPDGRLIAGAYDNTIYVWNITNLNSCLVGTFGSHSGNIVSIIFSSPLSLISISGDKSVKFWKVGVPSENQTTINLKSTLSVSTPIRSVSLQTKDEIAISCDLAGIVKIWDLSTGLPKQSFQTPATDYPEGDAKLIDGKLIFVWYCSGKIHIWDSEEGELSQKLDAYNSKGIRISGDGSKILSLSQTITSAVGTGSFTLEAWSMWTWELVGEVMLEKEWQDLDPLYMENSTVWVQSQYSQTQGWDFGGMGPYPTLLSGVASKRPYLDWIGNSVKDTTTGKMIFRLPGRYADPYCVQWDGQYLIAGYRSGEVLILDFYL